RCWEPDAGRPRPDRALRSAGDPRRGKAFAIRTAHRLRPVRDARALRDVRGGDLVCPDQAALLWGARCQGRRSRARPAIVFAADLPPPAGGLWRHRRGRRGRTAARLLRRAPLALGLGKLLAVLVAAVAQTVLAEADAEIVRRGAVRLNPIAELEEMR